MYLVTLISIKMDTAIFTFIIICFISVVMTSSFVSNKSSELREKLFQQFETDEYSYNMTGGPLRVSVSFHLVALVDIDELNSDMTTVGYMTVEWVDFRLTWNPADYAGITTLMVSADKVWTPCLLLGNPSRKIPECDASNDKVRILSSGTIIYMPVDVFNTRCTINVYKYPFDRQECHLSFLPWPYLESEIILITPSNQVPVPFFRANGGWILADTYAHTFVENQLSLAVFILFIERRSAFIVVSILLPVISICFLACLVFLIPHENGERISYTITVLLSFAVCMTLVSDNIPHTSDPMSLLSYYMFALFFGAVLIMLHVISHSRLSYKDPKIPISTIYKVLVAISRFKKVSSSENQVDVISVLDTNCAEKDQKVSHSSVDELTWKDVAMALDKVCFVVYLLYFTTLTCAVLAYSNA